MTLLLTQYRRSLGYDQQRMARHLGITVYDLRRAESGEWTLPRPSADRSLEDLLDERDRLLEALDRSARPMDQDVRRRMHLPPPPEVAKPPHCLGLAKFRALAITYKYRLMGKLPYPRAVCDNQGTLGSMFRDKLLKDEPRGVRLTPLGHDVLFLEYYRLRPSARLATSGVHPRDEDAPDLQFSRHPPLSKLLERMGYQTLEDAVRSVPRLKPAEVSALASMFHLTRENHALPPGQICSYAQVVRDLCADGMATMCRSRPERYFSSKRGRDRASLEHYMAKARGELA